MKAYLLLVLLLIPLAYSQEDVLEARKTNLDAKAQEFIIQMDIVVDFAKEKDVDSKKLEEIKANFEERLKEALEAETKEELLNKEGEMRVLAEEFKEETKDKLEDFGDELKETVKEKKEESIGIIKEKLKSFESQKKSAIMAAFGRKIDQLKSKIRESELVGKGTSVFRSLLRKFEERVGIDNSTEIDIKTPQIPKTSNISFPDVLPKTGTLSSIKDFFVEKIKEMGQK